MHVITLTPAETAERTGLTIDTLRYCENEGLLANIARASSGHRRYSDDDALWVEVLRCLRETGMTHAASCVITASWAPRAITQPRRGVES